MVVPLLTSLFASIAMASTAPALGPVAVYPIAGTHYNLPGTQITFRGVSASNLGPISVSGSASGAHSGHVVADSDGVGASFLPDKPFRPGETVTVTTHLGVIGGKSGRFSFEVATPAGRIPPFPLPKLPAAANGLARFRSRPDLKVPAVSVKRASAPASDGDIFVAPQDGPSQDGPMILDPRGQLVWFWPLSVAKGYAATDFRVQQFGGRPVLTWWQGTTNAGIGIGLGVIFDQHYRQIATVRAANGLKMDLHEFLLTPGGTALLFAASPVRVRGVANPVIDGVIQDIDIRTGLVLFEWHSLDFIPLKEGVVPAPPQKSHPYDPHHLNSVLPDATDSSLIVSARNTSTVYKVDIATGRIVWRLGGRSTSFKMGPGTATAFQHNAALQPDGTLTIFDDGAGPPTVHKYSRTIRVALDTRKMTARLVAERRHTPSLLAHYEGSAQLLPSGGMFVGWGQQPVFSQFDSRGRQVFDAAFNLPLPTYRAYRFPWHGQPNTRPGLAVAAAAGGRTTVYASWNGNTEVAAWRILAGATTRSLRVVGSSRRYRFESTMSVRSSGPYFQVQALGSDGQVLGTSVIVRR